MIGTTAADGAEGYVLDVDYIHNFLAGLAPLNLALAAVLGGVRPPDVDGAFAYLDLGCGNGFTPALLAAANPQATIWGNDFNPAHIRNAQATAKAAGVTNATFVEASFADLPDMDLPAFDIVAVHGIWSWVSPANRGRIVDLLARVVKPGGLVLVSYNCHPGWDSMLQLRRLMTMGEGTPAERIDRGLATARALRDAGADYFRSNPAACTALDRLEGADRAYLAHEYLNADWTLFHPREVHAAVAPAGLSYVGQARVLDTIDAVWLTEEQRALIAAESDASAAEALRDLILNRRYRRDLFVRGHAAVADAAAWFAGRRFVLTRPRGDCALSLEPRSAAEIPAEAVLDGVLDALVQGAANAGAIGAFPALHAASPEDVRAALIVLAGMGYVQPTLNVDGSETGAAARRGATDRFNAAALDAVRGGEPFAALASPVTGSGVPVPAEQQFLLDAARWGIDFGEGGNNTADRFRREGIPALAMLGIA